LVILEIGIESGIGIELDSIMIWNRNWKWKWNGIIIALQNDLE
jgi:hypothetical protein